MTSLQHNLHETPFNRQTRLYIFERLWRGSSIQKAPIPILDAYFEYYESQCLHALHERGRHLTVRTHEHIMQVARELERDQPKEAIKDNLTKLFESRDPTNKDEVLNNSVELVVRLYLMVNIGTSKSSVTSGQKLSWTSGTIKESLDAHFNEPPVLTNHNVRFEKSFTAVNLQRIAGIKIRWTNNLADHLRMVDDDDKIVAIFHHATFLKHQTSALLPAGLVDETLRTLALLFPQNDRATKKWINSLPATPVVDRQLNQCGQLRLDDRQIETYKFWHDRLIILKQAFDESRPATLSQWWCDRRNGYQWYTFWVAVFVLFLTIFFGMVQSIEGALQVWKAFHPSPG